jgi:DNA-binding LacI/PurR family transcriptional regulator
MANRRASIKDVARESGVSPTTVSLVLNRNDARISDGTRQRVLRTIDRLSYTPNRLARGLPNRRANTLAVLVPDFEPAFADPQTRQVMSGIYESAVEHGYRIVLEVVRPDFVRNREYMAMLDDCSVDGILFIGATAEHQWLSEFERSDHPLIIVNCSLDHPTLHRVECDYAAAGRTAADYLVHLGHTKIALLTGPSEQIDVSRDPMQAFAESLSLHNIGLDKSAIRSARSDARSVSMACEHLLDQNSGLTAIFCTSDSLGLGALQAIEGLGLEPGPDLSVIACGDSPAAACSDPPLATVRFGFFEMGVQACQALIGIIEGDASAGGDRSIPVTLIPRESCCSVPENVR